MSPQPVEILVRDVSSGRIHKRFRLEGSTELLSFEADNADEAGASEPISQEDVDAAPAHLLCKRCFAEDERYREGLVTYTITSNDPLQTITGPRVEWTANPAEVSGELAVEDDPTVVQEDPT